LADHPVRFFSALSLEKNAPSVGLCDVLGTSAFSLTKVNGSSNRRYAVGENCERMTTWLAGRREHWRAAAVSGDRTGMA